MATLFKQTCSLKSVWFWSHSSFYAAGFCFFSMYHIIVKIWWCSHDHLLYLLKQVNVKIIPGVCVIGFWQMCVCIVAYLVQMGLQTCLKWSPALSCKITWQRSKYQNIVLKIHCKWNEEFFSWFWWPLVFSYAPADPHVCKNCTLCMWLSDDTNNTQLHFANLVLQNDT